VWTLLSANNSFPPSVSSAALALDLYQNNNKLFKIERVVIKKCHRNSERVRSTFALDTHGNQQRKERGKLLDIGASAIDKIIVHNHRVVFDEIAQQTQMALMQIQ
jgi:hypothetical protein